MALIGIREGREEFRDGMWVTMPPASLEHFRLVQRLNAILREKLDSKQYVIGLSDFGLGVEPGRQACRNPDLVVFEVERLKNAKVQDNNLYCQPSLIAECLSPMDRKGRLTDLLADYSAMKAEEVWIIDPFAREVERWMAAGSLPSGRLEDRSAQLVADLVCAEVQTRGPMPCPGLAADLAVDIDSLWRAYDGDWEGL